jgi:transcriptional regulator with XRE-family HTH domain
MATFETKKYADFGKALSNLLAIKGVSQKEFCDTTGVNKSQVSKWVNGNTTPRPATIVEIGRLYGVVFEMSDSGVTVRARKAQDYLYDELGDTASLIQEPPAGPLTRDDLLKHLELIEASARIVADGLRRMK